MAAVVGVSRENCEGAVELLGEHDAGEFVRVGHRAERKLLLDTQPERIAKAVRISANEDNFARAAIALLAKPFSERFRVVLFSAGVEKKRCCSAIRVELLDCRFGITNLGDFDGAGMRDASIEAGARLCLREVALRASTVATRE